MEISRRADYGVRVIIHLASLPDNQRASTQEIAAGQSVPAPFLSKIISQLSLAGLLVTHRGAGGGVALAQSPAKISLLQVIEALEGPIRLNRCLAEPHACPRDQQCPVHHIWQRAQNQLTSLLESTTFDTLVDTSPGRRESVPSEQLPDPAK